MPHFHLQQLHWLGIRTLGQFAALPPAAVLQRFGAAGRQAQRWAQGRDDRPVAAAVPTPPAPVIISLEPPSSTLQPVVEAVMCSLRPLLAGCAASLQGVRRLRLVLVFAGGADQRTAEVAFVEPASSTQRVQAALVQQLAGLRWPAEVQTVQWALLETGELVAPQLELFAEAAQRSDDLAQLAQALSVRHGASLFQAAIAQANHPVPERRSVLLPLPAHVAPLA